MPDQFTPSPNPPQPSVPPALLVVGVVAAFILCVVAFLAGMQWNRSVAMNGNGGYPVIPDVEQEADPLPPEEPVEEVPVEEEEELPPGEPMSVEWMRISETDVDPVVKAVVGQTDGSLVLPENQSRAWALGYVKGGDYDGRLLTLQSVGYEGMGVQYTNLYVLVDRQSDNFPVVLVRHGTYSGFGAIAGQMRDLEGVKTRYEEASNGRMFVDIDHVVPELETAPTDWYEGDLPQVGSFVFLGLGSRFDFPQTMTPTQYPEVATLPDGTVLRQFTRELDPDSVFSGILHGLFAVRSEDGRLMWYEPSVPFWPKDTDVAYGVPRVSFNGVANTEHYVKGATGGCGMSSPSNIRSEEDMKAIGTLVPAGTSTDDASVVIYKPASWETEYMKERSGAWYIQNEGLTVEDFAATNPFFYWKDAYGRWMEFVNAQVMPPAECGKPVIYLYPEETTDISVRLFPQGGFTKTEPAYGNGWNVTASPDGTLVNKADGLTYPYLFWEGRGGLYTEPTRYWVVKRENVHVFLVDTLAKLGLNEKETADFLEFWEPRMQAAPYYKIGFHGTNVMDQIAPLKLSERPDTILRILMDYQELSAPIAENPPRLPATPVRNGFTLIEWGGVIR